jgi:hypothetical protein
MENAGWLEQGINKEELARIKKLHAITKFMVNNGANIHTEIKEKLEPICNRLEQAIALNTAGVDLDEDKVANEITVRVAQQQPEAKKDKVQSRPAINAVENVRPTATPNLFSRLVNSITNIFAGGNAVDDDNTATSIKIKT